MEGVQLNSGVSAVSPFCNCSSEKNCCNVGDIDFHQKHITYLLKHFFSDYCRYFLIGLIGDQGLKKFKLHCVMRDI